MRRRLIKKDVNFEQCLPELAEAIFWLSVQMYPIYVAEGLIQPKLVEDYAREHWEDNDPYQSFIGERLTKVKVKKDETLSSSNSVVVSDIYPQFKIFFKAQNPQSAMPTSSQFKTQMVQRLGDQTGKRWPGWVIRDEA
jgi:phage/plasmid-associated DNA primase